MYLLRRRRTKRRKKIRGRGVKRPYINKRNRLMLGKGKQGGGFLGPVVAAVAPALLGTIKQMLS